MTDKINGQELFKKLKGQKKKAVRAGAPEGFSCDDWEAFPLLSALLTTIPTDGPDRRPGRLGFFVQDGVLTCCVSVPGAGATAFVVLDSFEKALVALEEMLEADSLNWREDTPKQRNGSK